MAVPAQALAAEKAANELHQKAYGKPEEAPAGDVNGEAPPIKAEDITKTPTDSDTWEHKFKVLQGKYNAEVKADVHKLNQTIDDLKKQNQTLIERNQALETQVNSLSALATQNEKMQEQLKTLQLQVEQSTKAPEGTTDTSEIGDDMLSPEEREHLEDQDLDGKTMAIIARISERSMKKGIKSVEDRIQGIEEKLETKEKNDSKTAFDRFREAVVSGVGGQAEFDRLNKDPLFHGPDGWLSKPLPYSDKTRRDRMNELRDEMNVNAIVQMFKDFAATLKPAGKDPKREKYTPPGKEELVDPTGDAVSGAGDHTTENLITQQQMNAHYLKAAKDPMGYGRSEAYQKMEARINQQLESQYKARVTAQT